MPDVTEADHAEPRCTWCQKRPALGDVWHRLSDGSWRWCSRECMKALIFGFIKRDPAYCSHLCVATDSIDTYVGHTALCEAKHAAGGGVVTCPRCGVTDEYEGFSSHGRCHSCQWAVCREAAERTAAEVAAAEARKGPHHSPPAAGPFSAPRGWDRLLGWPGLV